MANYCKQCSKELFGLPSDFKGITKPNTDKFAVVLCEGCGSIQVDSDGKCISEDCEKKDA